MPGTAPDQPIELEITNVAHGGIFVARHEGRVVFVSDAIPGERVLARVTDARKKKFWRAETTEVLEPSEHRREHVWAEASVERDPAERAGGAEFGHIALDHQRALKHQVLSEAFEKFAGQAAPAFEMEAVAGDDEKNGLGWRTRVRLHVDDEGRMGPYAARSHTVVPVSSLPLATPRLAEIIELDALVEGAASLDLIDPSGFEPLLCVGDDDLKAAGTVTERVGDSEFTVDAGGFWQVHHGAAATLTEAVQHGIDSALFDPRAHNLDLYGGVGLLAAAVQARFGDTVRITSVEADAAATRHARHNLAPGAEAVTARVDRYLSDLQTHMSAVDRRAFRDATVVLDPPRAGAGTAITTQIAQLEPAQIVYVACDPVALARDAGAFTASGYRLTSLRAFDLFPHTHHMEAVASFERS
ncbi:class I SAM-dependent RNA methyltransferase [Microbacterium sp. MPKO10]|uniref:class I SAM-dependent RNA methyltransferase n=1 Tax=Microbacterium sp. MPKO10 TaxID=2989818 RepID=UPI0022368A96|nr:TRAM domain-containing protein [Microbacterium sp. MPKO10]MCW4457779.1 class I SAM-dependent RNA methyltransferase [Microbacterium sp. MPKO10]